MNKSQLINVVAEKTEMKKKDVELVVDTMINTIYDTLKSRDKVTVSGFGTFETKHRKERNGVNPKTGEKIIVTEAILPIFKAGKTFKEEIK
ncbi:HU family DNA-binding protein [Mycoplasmatota bacterium]|nr:HU family DNA-binding protein [Mycoplasmatota bacterium]